MTPTPSSATASDKAATVLKMLQRQIAKNGILDYNGQEETITLTLTKSQWDRIGAALEAAPPDESLEAAVEERLTDLRRIKAEGIAERRGAKEMMAQTGIATCEWFLKLIAEAKAQKEPKEMRA